MPTTRTGEKNGVPKTNKAKGEVAGSKHQIQDKAAPESKRPKKEEEEEEEEDKANEDKIPRYVHASIEAHEYTFS